MSDAIIDRIDQMGTRIDDLERSINDLMEQAGVEPDPELLEEEQGQGQSQSQDMGSSSFVGDQTHEG